MPVLDVSIREWSAMVQAQGVNRTIFHNREGNGILDEGLCKKNQQSIVGQG